jgi:hypothetical protein
VNLLRRIQAPPQEACEICAVPIAPEHGHLVDLRDRRLLCACRPCYLLFVPEGAAQGRYRAVGDRFVSLRTETLDGPQWEALQIPIGLAFFFYRGDTNQINAFYPGPGGATESQLSLEAWETIAGSDPAIAQLRPDIEAALIDRRRGETPQGYVVPIDICYELAGIVRKHWQGFDGGLELRHELGNFFARVRERCL